MDFLSIGFVWDFVVELFDFRESEILMKIFGNGDFIKKWIGLFYL